MNYLVDIKSESNSNINVVGVLKDYANKSFKGTIDFKAGAKKAIGRVDEKVLLLSDDVKSRSLPMLLCGEEDVTANHTLAVSNFDEDKLFYLMSRGYSYDEAISLVVRGFANPISKSFPVEYAVEMNRLINLELEGSIG